MFRSNSLICDHPCESVAILRHLDSDNVRDAPVREENDKKIRDRKIARMPVRVEVGSCDILVPCFLVKFFGVIEWND